MLAHHPDHASIMPRYRDVRQVTGHDLTGDDLVDRAVRPSSDWAD